MQMLVERKDSWGDVVEHPVHAFEEVLPRHGGTAHDTPVMRLDTVQI